MDPQTERPRISNQPISVLLPVYNQATGLETIVENWLRGLFRLDRPFEFIVVDDASADDSAAILAKIATRHSELRIVRHDARRGYGACLRSALAVATHPLIFYTACDYPYSPADITKLLDVIDSADLASGCRSEPAPSLATAARQLASPVFPGGIRVFAGIAAGVARLGLLAQALRLRLLFGIRVWDPTSAFKLFRRSVLDRIPIQSNGEFVHAELLAKANFLGCMMAEVQIGRLAGNFKGMPEPPAPDGAGDARRMFRRPTASADWRWGRQRPGRRRAGWHDARPRRLRACHPQNENGRGRLTPPVEDPLPTTG